MAVPANPIFVARTLRKTYGSGATEVVALRDVSLEIAAGEFVVLLGPSGSGKSTLLNILGGLDVPTSGEVWFADHRLDGADEAALTRYRREHVGFVFQFYNLIPSLTVRENVALVTDIAEHPMDIDEALGLVDLMPRRDHFPAQLSGGEQQRVAIARAIVKRPDVLLCDEPTGALDFSTGKRVLEAIADINQRLGTTAVVITHNAAIARAIVKRPDVLLCDEPTGALDFSTGKRVLEAIADINQRLGTTAVVITHNAAIARMADRVLYLGDGTIQREERHAQRASASEVAW